eukprot:998311-Rhodomonas_salina.3
MATLWSRYAHAVVKACAPSLSTMSTSAGHVMIMLWSRYGHVMVWSSPLAGAARYGVFAEQGWVSPAPVLYNCFATTSTVVGKTIVHQCATT